MTKILNILLYFPLLSYSRICLSIVLNNNISVSWILSHYSPFFIKFLSSQLILFFRSLSECMCQLITRCFIVKLCHDLTSVPLIWKVRYIFLFEKIYLKVNSFVFYTNVLMYYSILFWDIHVPEYTRSYFIHVRIHVRILYEVDL